ncbi:MAG: hypothetical protein ABI707_01620 [Ferruginibacter sp.]
MLNTAGGSFAISHPGKRRCFCYPNQIGRLKKGMLADPIAVTGDPFKNIFVGMTGYNHIEKWHPL